jgi:hypothetical protein
MKTQANEALKTSYDHAKEEALKAALRAHLPALPAEAPRPEGRPPGGVPPAGAFPSAAVGALAAIGGR